MSVETNTAVEMSTEMIVALNEESVIVAKKVCDKRRCSCCKEEKELTAFIASKARCRICLSNADKIYRSTFDGFLQRLIADSSTRSKTHKPSAKSNKSEHTITKQDLLVKYQEQSGKCYYSGIPMKNSHHVDWLMTIERLDNLQGYTNENTVLCCHEFNSGRSQWTIDKINLIPRLSKVKIDICNLKSIILTARKKRSWQCMPRKKYIEKVSDDGAEKKCHICDEFRPLGSFVKDPLHGCMSCRKKCSIDYSATLRGFMTRLVGNAKTRTKTRNEKGHSHEFDISLDFVLDLILSQNGRCHYSSIPLVFASGSDWMCSIERLNNDIGYIKDNIVLICNEFNTTSLTCRATSKDEVTGSGQWSVPKFNYLLSQFTSSSSSVDSSSSVSSVDSSSSTPALTPSPSSLSEGSIESD